MTKMEFLDFFHAQLEERLSIFFNLDLEKRPLPELSVEEKTVFSIDLLTDLFDMLCEALVQEGRIEVRGFGSFSVKHLSARMVRNPKTGEKVPLLADCRVHFKMGKKLMEALNACSTPPQSI